MSKGLDALERLVDGNLNEVNYYRQFCDSTTYIMKDKETIEKELKALEIINKKEVSVGALKELDFEHYNMYARDILGVRTLTQKEYDLLKEVLL